MSTMKVRITSADRPKWYYSKIGETFVVKTAEWQDTGLHEVVPYSYGNAIHKDHFEIVEDDKIVEHEGIKYKVPTWAKFLTRDSTESSSVWAWEVEPEWRKINSTEDRMGYYLKAGCGSRHVAVEPYEEPKPEGNFIKEI